MQPLLSLLFFAFVLPCLHTQAQGALNQNGKIIKLKTQQLALLQTYHTALKQGYRIIESAVQLTNDLKNGEFGLHNIYYNSLLSVTDQIKKYPEVGQTLDLYNKMEKARSAVYSNAKNSGLFTAGELKYIAGVYTNLFKAAEEDLKELQQLTTEGELKMGDDERLTRIDGVYKRMLQKFKALTAFNNRIIITLNGRKNQQQNAAILKKLYGL